MNGTLRALLAVFVVMYAADARAQATAQINGTVSDSSGDVLPGVTVTATHMATGVRREAVTDATGSYSLPLIYGDDLRGLGEGFESFTPRLRPDGTLVPRNGFVGDPVHRVDMRLQERIPLGGRRSIDGIFELFNLFNRANYGSYVTDEASPQFGQAEYNSNLAYAPRTLQLGFRLTF